MTPSIDTLAGQLGHRPGPPAREKPNENKGPPQTYNLIPTGTGEPGRMIYSCARASLRPYVFDLQGRPGTPPAPDVPLNVPLSAELPYYM